MTTCKGAHLRDVSGTLSGGRTASTFELQMLRDQVRRRELAARMRTLREESPYTQEAIADKIGLKLRSYQKAEQTGGISYEKLQALAGVHEVDFDWLLKGSEKGPAPDLLATMEGERSSDGAYVSEERMQRLEALALRNQQLLLAIVHQLGISDEEQYGAEAAAREFADAMKSLAATGLPDQDSDASTPQRTQAGRKSRRRSAAG